MLEPEIVRGYQRKLSSIVDAACKASDGEGGAGKGDPAAFAQVLGLLDAAIADMSRAAAELRAAGYSWTDIGNALGITRASAQQRFGGKARVR